MFNFLLKRKSHIALLLSTVLATTSTMVITASPRTTVEESSEAQVSNLNELIEAHTIVKDLKKRVKQFFSKKNKESYGAYLRDLEITMGKIRTLINLCPQSTPERDRLILEILNKINFVLNEIHKTLNQPYNSGKKLAENLQKTIKIYVSPAEINHVKQMVEELKTYLNQDEASELDNMLNTITSIQKVVPSMKIVCLSRISKRLRIR